MIWELKDGNCNLILVAALVLSYQWLERRPALSGVALGFAISIKYLPVIYLPYLLLRGRLQAASWTILSAAAFAVIPAVVFGLDRNSAYLKTAYRGLLGLAGTTDTTGANIHPLAWRSSISLTSVTARLVERGHLPHGSIWLIVLALAAATAATIIWMYRRAGVPLILNRSQSAEQANPALRLITLTEWTGLMAAALIFSPQTVARHINLTLPFIAIGAWLLLHKPRCIGLATSLAALCISLFFRIHIDRESGAPDPWRDLGGISWCLLIATLTIAHAATSPFPRKGAGG
jgi:hypothetical protein